MPGCEHTRTEFLMRRDSVDYVRCLQCGAVVEADDLEQLPAFDDLDEADNWNSDRKARRRAS